jgi:hypothetical protein
VTARVRPTTPLARLHALVPERLPVLSRWLLRQGLTRFDIEGYRRSGWLVSLGHGLYLRGHATDVLNHPLDWRAAIASLQAQGWPVHVGGATALLLHGLAHDLPLGQLRVDLYSNKRPAAWLAALATATATDWQWQQKTLFHAPEPTITTADQLVHPPPPAVAGRLGVGTLAVAGTGLLLACSTPERAILEIIAALPKQSAWAAVSAIFAGLVHLRPGLLSTLLHATASSQSKRLFMVQASWHRHHWLPYLQLEGIDFGRGKYQAYAGGVLHPIYQITTPGIDQQGAEDNDQY